MKIIRFEDIIAWQKAKELTIQLFIILKNNRDYYYKDQIIRASISIMNNIAEGFGRKSPLEFKRFLSISNGSCNEVLSMLYVGLEFGYFTDLEFNKLSDLAREIARLLNGFINSINTELTKTKTKTKIVN